MSINFSFFNPVSGLKSKCPYLKIIVYCTLMLETNKYISVAHITVPANALVRADLGVILRNKLRDEFEGMCNQEGFVKKIDKIDHVGYGRIIEGADTCPITFPVAYSSDIIKINQGDLIFGARITMIEEFGIVANKDGIIDIVIKSSDLPENYESKFNINDNINIRAQIDGEFTVKGNKIYTIGKLHYYTMHNSLDKVCKFITKNTGLPSGPSELKIKFLTTTEPAEQKEALGFDIKFKEYKDRLGFDKGDDRKYRIIRDTLNPYELLWPTEQYKKLSHKSAVPKIQVISRAYFKMWEILKTFSKLVDTKKSNFICANLAEGPGGFIQAILDYREKYSSGSAGDDKFYAITLPGDQTAIPKFDKDFVKKHEGKKLFIKHGDLTNPKDVQEFIKKFTKNEADLVTGDAGFQFDIAGYDIQEQLIQQLLFSQLLIALSIQKKGGSFVCKMFDAYTEPTIFILQLVRKYYKTAIIFKPETSRPANSEKYIIAYRFNGISQEELKKLHGLHQEWHKLDPSGGLKPTKFISKFIGHEISQDFLDEIKVYNQKLTKFQKESIYEITATLEGSGGKIDNEYYDKQEKIGIEWCKKMDIPV